MSGENKKTPAKVESNLPTIQELYKDKELAIAENQLNALMNQEPQKSWVREHPTVKKEIKLPDGKTAKVPSTFLPINRVEWLLTRIFLKWRVEILKIQLIANSVTTTVRLHYKNPLDSEWDFQDGVGAAPIQTDSKAGAIDFNKMKSNAIQMSAPASESFAIKDAAHKIGRLFGKDLNRDAIAFYDEAMEKASEKLTFIQLRDEVSKAIKALTEGEFKEDIKKEALEAEESDDPIQGLNDLLDKIELSK